MGRKVLRTRDGYFLVVPEGATVQRTFSYAAWYENVELEPGIYQMHEADRSNAPYRARAYTVAVPGTIIARDTTPAFGGVPYPSETSRANDQKYIGRKTVEHITLDATFVENAPVFDDDGKRVYVLIEDEHETFGKYWARPVTVPRPVVGRVALLNHGRYSWGTSFGPKAINEMEALTFEEFCEQYGVIPAPVEESAPHVPA